MELLDLQALSDEELHALLTRLPKSDLHCHLDGSMRVETIAELLEDGENRDLANELGYPLPEYQDIDELRGMLVPGIDCQSLVEYLTVFDITCAVLQSPENLERAAYEMGIDAASEGVRYLEVRFAPMRHVHPGLSGLEVLRAVDRGLSRAEEEAPRPLSSTIIVCAMRNFHEDNGDYYRRMTRLFANSPAKELAPIVSVESARLAIKARDEGLRVSGFDLAGPEAHYPASDHVQAFYRIMNNLLSITVHAGEGYGPESIQEAVTYLNAHRIGHGTRIMEDETGRLVNYLRDKRLAVEVCLTSNLQTKAVKSLGEHPLRALLDGHVRTAICTDNRLVSDTTVTDELLLACRHFDFSARDLKNVTLNGFKSAFLPYQERVELIMEAKRALHREKLHEVGVY